jgi:hypothetical protein
MEAVVSILVQLIGGGIGGNGLAAIVKKLSLGPAGNTIAGAIGGWLGTWLAGMIPGLDGIVKGAAATGAAVSGLDFGTLAGQGVTGIVGGAILTAIAGAIKNMSTRNA